jgi:hypothetical protein
MPQMTPKEANMEMIGHFGGVAWNIQEQSATPGPVL